MRRFAAAVLLAGLSPAAAMAAPVPLGPADPGQARVAGDAAIIGSSSFGDTTVSRTPLTGEGTQAILNVPRVKGGAGATSEVAATAERAAAVVSTSSAKGYSLTNQAFAGPAAGPLAALTAPVGAAGNGFVPDEVDIAGSATVLTGRAGPQAKPAMRAVEADGTSVAVNVPSDATFVDFAGDLVAYGRPTRGETEEDPNVQLEIANWRTGTSVRSVTLPAGILGLDLRDDGAVVVDTDGAGVLAIAPGADPVRIAGRGDDPVWAGDRVVVTVKHDAGFQSLRMIDADGTARDFGTPSGQIDGVNADAANVVWTANGCALTAPVTDTAGTALAPGGCPHAEALLQFASRAPARTVRLPLRCLVATVACKGRLDGSGVRSGAFRVPAGRVGSVRLRLKPAAVERIKRSASRSLRVKQYLRDGYATNATVTFKRQA